MDWLIQLVTGNGVAHAIFFYSIVIALGVMLGKVKFFGISLGSTFVLFPDFVIVSPKNPGRRGGRWAGGAS